MNFKIKKSRHFSLSFYNKKVNFETRDFSPQIELILASVFSLNLIFRPACVLLHYKRVLGFYYEFFSEIFLFNNWCFFSHAEEVFSTRKGLYLLLFMQAYAFFRSRYTDAK